MILDCGKQLKLTMTRTFEQAHPSETDVKSSYLSSFNGADSVSPCMGGHGVLEELLKPKHCIKSRSMGLHIPWVGVLGVLGISEAMVRKPGNH